MTTRRRPPGRRGSAGTAAAGLRLGLGLVARRALDGLGLSDDLRPAGGAGGGRGLVGLGRRRGGLGGGLLGLLLGGARGGDLLAAPAGGLA